jgi:hypothetical protein
MNDDYLWDKTGEPDPEILELEQVLGTLRYQPRSLEIPETLHIEKKRTFFPSFAIAAAIALMIAGVGLWLVLRNQSETVVRSPPLNEGPVIQAPDSQPKSLAPSNTNSGKEAFPNSSGIDKTLKRQAQRQRTSDIPKPALAGNKSRGRRLVVKSPELTASERAEARIAKEQLLFALRVASSKLSLAQKKAQGTYPANLIRNQHKIG